MIIRGAPSCRNPPSLVHPELRPWDLRAPLCDHFLRDRLGGHAVLAGRFFTGAILWIGIFIVAGHAFGNMPFVQKNIKVVILGIIIVSVLPIAWEVIKARKEKRSKAST